MIKKPYCTLNESYEFNCKECIHNEETGCTDLVIKILPDPVTVIETADKREVILSPLQADLLKILNKNGPTTRQDLIQALNKPRTTIYDNLKGLIYHKIVKKYSRPVNSRGRPLVFFKVIEGV